MSRLSAELMLELWITEMDEEILIVRLQRAESDLREAQATLKDAYAQAALTGLLAYHGAIAPADDVVSAAFSYAIAALKLRGKQ